MKYLTDGTKVASRCAHRLNALSLMGGHVKTFKTVLAAVALASTATSVNAGVVISQVYGGGGNSGATYTNDFVELFNAGSSAVSLAGWSLQYTSATGTGIFGADAGLLTELSGTLQPGQYFLVQEAAGGGGTTLLPTPNVTDGTPINMSATGGKVALVNSTVSLGCNGGSTSCSLASLGQIVDLVGYGVANFYEGAGAAPTLSNTMAAFRAGDGCTDTDNNNSDFSAGAPNPRNSASPVNLCSGNGSVPAPATLALLGIGVAGLAATRRRKTR